MQVLIGKTWNQEQIGLGLTSYRWVKTIAAHRTKDALEQGRTDKHANGRKRKLRWNKLVQIFIGKKAPEIPLY